MMGAQPEGSQNGVTVIEVLVAIVLFALVAAASAQVLVVAQHARRSSANWMQATQLAAERLERLRAGDRSTDPGPIGIFTRSWRSVVFSERLRLQRLDVTVTWVDGGVRAFTLSALVRQDS